MEKPKQWNFLILTNITVNPLIHEYESNVNYDNEISDEIQLLFDEQRLLTGLEHLKKLI